MTRIFRKRCESHSRPPALETFSPPIVLLVLIGRWSRQMCALFYDSSVHMSSAISKVPAGSSISQEDQAMSRAVEASLKDSFVDDVYEEPPPDDQVRNPDATLIRSLVGRNSEMTYNLLALDYFVLPALLSRIRAQRMYSLLPARTLGP